MRFLRCLFILLMGTQIAFAEVEMKESFDESMDWAGSHVAAPTDLSVFEQMEISVDTNIEQAGWDQATLDRKAEEAMESEEAALNHASEEQFSSVATMLEEKWIEGENGQNLTAVKSPEKIIVSNYKDCEQVPILGNEITTTQEMSCKEAVGLSDFECHQHLEIEGEKKIEHKSLTVEGREGIKLLQKDMLSRGDERGSLSMWDMYSNDTVLIWLASMERGLPTPKIVGHYQSRGKKGVNKGRGFTHPIYKIYLSPTGVASHILVAAGEKSENIKEINYIHRDGIANVINYVIEEDNITSEQWHSNCGQLENFEENGTCFVVDSVCTAGPETRDINGMSVTRDCWERKVTYRCGANNTSQCPDYRKLGCEQIGQTCVQKIGDTCLEYQKKYRCVSKQKEPTGQYKLVCAEEPFCINGDCLFTGYEPNNDMLESVAQLKIFQELGKQLKQEGVRVFTGKNNECRKECAGFRNCCGKGAGWGSSLGASCNETEKNLAKERDKGLCHANGTYCAHKVLGVCTVKKQSYCCFHSKIIRILHEQIRPQIGRGWGEADSPDCAGLTIEELAKADWEKIDLSEIFADVLKDLKVPDTKNLEKNVNSTVASKVQKKYA